MTFEEWLASRTANGAVAVADDYRRAAAAGWVAALVEVVKMIRDGAAYHHANADDDEVPVGDRLHSALIASNYASMANRLIATMGGVGAK